MREHLQRRTLPAGGDREVLWKLIGELHSEPLDRSRPMWMAYLIDGLEGGRFAFYMKVHHTVVDGVAGLRMIADALSTDPESRSMRPIYAIGPKQPARRAGNSRGGIRNPLSLVRSALSGVTSGLGLVGQLAVGEVSTVVASLGAGTTVLPFGAPYGASTIARCAWPVADLPQRTTVSAVSSSARPRSVSLGPRWITVRVESSGIDRDAPAAPRWTPNDVYRQPISMSRGTLAERAAFDGPAREHFGGDDAEFEHARVGRRVEHGGPHRAGAVLVQRPSGEAVRQPPQRHGPDSGCTSRCPQNRSR